MDKAKSNSISLPASYWEKLQTIADQEHGGNRTKAIKAFIDQNENSTNTVDLDRQKPISDLIRRYTPLIVRGSVATSKGQTSPARHDLRSTAPRKISLACACQWSLRIPKSVQSRNFYVPI